jgi:hypothetical protein
MTHPILSSKEIHMFSFLRRLPLAEMRIQASGLAVLLVSLAGWAAGSNWN